MKKGSGDETGPSSSKRGTVQRTCLRLGCGGLLVGGMGTSFASTLESKIGVNKGSGGRTMVGILGKETDVASLGQKVLT